MLLPTTEALPDRTPVDSVSAEQAAALMLDGHMAALSIITVDMYGLLGHFL